ncbi:MAG: glycoside hydrolase family 5 protein [Cyclobacteriaceae bacterium]|nr:glycoside hydrolase family 5 protein [Cyclobacteriaceae bacterium]
MKHLTLNFLISIVLFACADKGAVEQSEAIKYPWKTYRGANAGIGLTEKDIMDFKATGGNLIRLSFPVIPFAAIDSPYVLQNAAFSILDHVLNICEREEIAVLIDPHRFPGTNHQWTMLNTDSFWREKKYQDKAIEIWQAIATRTAHRGQVVAGYDLLNEPALEGIYEKESLSDLNMLYKRMIDAIRAIDTVHTIVLAAPRYLANDSTASHSDQGYVEGLRVLEAPDDDNLAVEVHMYKPMGFTHQGIWDGKDSISAYPGTYHNGTYWDKGTIDRYMKNAYDWGQKHQIPIFVGEFSCPRILGEMGNNYIRDCIEVFEKYDFSWAYHAWRENQIWDAEMSIYDRADSTRNPNADRITLLKSYFQKNEQ